MKQKALPWEKKATGQGYKVTAGISKRKLLRNVKAKERNSFEEQAALLLSKINNTHSGAPVGVKGE